METKEDVIPEWQRVSDKLWVEFKEDNREYKTDDNCTCSILHLQRVAYEVNNTLIKKLEALKLSEANNPASSREQKILILMGIDYSIMVLKGEIEV